MARIWLTLISALRSMRLCRMQTINFGALKIFNPLGIFTK